MLLIILNEYTRVFDVLESFGLWCVKVVGVSCFTIYVFICFWCNSCSGWMNHWEHVHGWKMTRLTKCLGVQIMRSQSTYSKVFGAPKRMDKRIRKSWHVDIFISWTCLWWFVCQMTFLKKDRFRNRLLYAPPALMVFFCIEFGGTPNLFVICLNQFCISLYHHLYYVCNIFVMFEKGVVTFRSSRKYIFLDTPANSNLTVRRQTD